MQYKAPVGLHRATPEHGLIIELLIGTFQFELRKEFAHREIGRTINNQAHSALIVVLTQQSDRTGKVAVIHAGHGDK